MLTSQNKAESLHAALMNFVRKSNSWFNFQEAALSHLMQRMFSSCILKS